MVLRYFLLLLLISILLAGRLLWPFVSILVLSFLLTSVFRPIYNRLNRQLPALIASFLTCALVVLLVFIPLVFFVAALAQEAQGLYEWGRVAGVGLGEKLRAFQESLPYVRLQETAAAFGFSLEPEQLGRALAELVRTAGLFLYNQVSNWAADVVMFVFSFFLMFITIFFLLIEQDRLLDYILRLSPLPDEQERQLFAKFEEVTNAVLIGNGICAVIQGVLGGVIFAILGLGPPVLWGAIMAVLAFLPIFGVGLVMVPSAGFLLFKGNLAAGIVLLVLYGLIAVGIENFLKPKLVGSRVRMHTLLVLLSILGGLSAFGFLGLIYGPLIITAFLTLAEIYLANYDHYVKGENLLSESVADQGGSTATAPPPGNNR